MEKMRLGIIESIDTAHYLPGHETCGIVHGHTYRVEVVIEGKKNDGMVMDFADLKKIVKDILKDYDHTLLNNILSYPSSENLCENIYSKLSEKLKMLVKVRIWEGEGKWCEIDSTTS
ncbi:6-carboxytetrahydropterin synthase QueD [Methanohalobium sp.]|uniref:6-carboxytetrahydropterin synthase QueD n=1 Tax=Methanohalobium sp. TaxID=2837493 RepID=UPI0025EA0D11|nr:6-carboxytetrahydropterin synthase QueD [Methanohalobium sp.]